jgi:hypothetical protein
MKYAVLLLAFLFSFQIESSIAQKFNGVECGKPLNETVAAFLAKGFVKEQSDPKKPHCLKFAGYINGVKHEVSVLASKKTKIVWKFSVWLPASYTWSSSKSAFLKYKEIFIKKYGEPISDYNFFISPYEEGDGSEMLALNNDKCTYACYFKDEVGNGLIIKLVSATYGEAHVVLGYENKIASKLDDEENSEVEQNTY